MSCPCAPSASARARRHCVHFRFALDEDLADQGLEGLCEGRIRDVALVLVELACREKPARRHKRFMQLVDHRGFADAGIAGHQHELRRALRHDPIKGREQGGDLALSSVKLFRDQQSVRSVVRAQRKWIDATVRLPLASGTDAGRPRRPRRSDNAPLRSSREASSRSTKAPREFRSPAHQARRPAAQCGSGPIPSDRKP